MHGTSGAGLFLATRQSCQRPRVPTGPGPVGHVPARRGRTSPARYRAVAVMATAPGADRSLAAQACPCEPRPDTPSRAPASGVAFWGSVARHAFGAVAGGGVLGAGRAATGPARRQLAVERAGKERVDQTAPAFADAGCHFQKGEAHEMGTDRG